MSTSVHFLKSKTAQCKSFSRAFIFHLWCLTKIAFTKSPSREVRTIWLILGVKAYSTRDRKVASARGHVPSTLPTWGQNSRFARVTRQWSVGGPALKDCLLRISCVLMAFAERESLMPTRTPYTLSIRPPYYRWWTCQEENVSSGCVHVQCEFFPTKRSWRSAKLPSQTLLRGHYISIAAPRVLKRRYGTLIIHASVNNDCTDWQRHRTSSQRGSNYRDESSPVFAFPRKVQRSDTVDSGAAAHSWGPRLYRWIVLPGKKMKRKAGKAKVMWWEMPLFLSLSLSIFMT